MTFQHCQHPTSKFLSTLVIHMSDHRPFWVGEVLPLVSFFFSSAESVQNDKISVPLCEMHGAYA